METAYKNSINILVCGNTSFQTTVTASIIRHDHFRDVVVAAIGTNPNLKDAISSHYASVMHQNLRIQGERTVHVAIFDGRRVPDPSGISEMMRLIILAYETGTKILVVHPGKRPACHPSWLDNIMETITLIQPPRWMPTLCVANTYQKVCRCAA